MSECSHDCSTCASKKNGTCGSENNFVFRAPENEGSHVKRVVAIMSGKGGVGKSLVTELLAVAATKRGLKVAVLDADITGPSIPTAFGVTERAVSDGENILPCKSATGISVMSINLLVDNPSDPVVWRGPVIAGAVKQFWSDVSWGDIDVMFIDMPPGTGDVPLTVFQSLPIDAAVVVTTPQDLVAMIVEKAVRMTRLMKIPVKGIVENMSSFKCPDCGKTHHLFGEQDLELVAKTHGIDVYAELPIDPKLAKIVDQGEIESYETDALDAILDELLKMEKAASNDAEKK